MSNVLYRNFSFEFPQAVRAEGSWVFDAKGKKYLDLSGGAFVNTLGHGRVDLIERIAERMKKLTYVNGMHFTSPALEEYASKILKYAPRDFSYVGLLNSGSEAVEAALKLVRQSYVEKGKPKKHKIIARSPGYHGNTGLALSVSARASYKKLFGPYMTDVDFVTAPQEFRGKEIDFAKELDKKITKLGAANVSTFIIETIMGSSGACSVPSKEYLLAVEEVCRKHDVKIIADEIACGAGRTGEYFACRHFDFSPDVIVLGKGVNAGIIPTSVVLAKENIVSPIKKGSGAFMHNQTYMHSPMMAACALEVLAETEKLNLLQKVKAEGPSLGQLLAKELLPLEHVGAVTGKGFFWGITLVGNKEKKTWLPPAEKIISKLFKKSKDLGLILWPVTGDEDSKQPDCFVIAPPFTIGREDLELGVSKLKTLLDF